MKSMFLTKPRLSKRKKTKNILKISEEHSTHVALTYVYLFLVIGNNYDTHLNCSTSISWGDDYELDGDNVSDESEPHSPAEFESDGSDIKNNVDI